MQVVFCTASLADTFFLDDSKTEVVAFDCGPGNMVIDGLMQDLFDEPFDRNGQMVSCV